MREFTQVGIEYSAIMSAIWFITGSSTPSDIKHKPTAEYWDQYAVKETDIDPFITQFFAGEDEPRVIEEIKNKLTNYIGRIHGAPGEFLRRAPVTGNVMFRPITPEDEIEPSVVKFAKSEYERLNTHFEGQGPTYEVILQDINNVYYDPLQVLLMNVVKDKRKSLGVALTTMEEYDPDLSLLHNAIIGHTSYPVWIPRIEVFYNEHSDEYSFRTLRSYVPKEYHCLNTGTFAEKTMGALCFILNDLITRLNPKVKMVLSPYIPGALEYFDVSLADGVNALSDINFESVTIARKQ